MNRARFAAIGLSLFVLGNVACGDNKPPPKPPESTPAATTDEGGSSTSSTDTAGSDAGAGDKTTSTPPPAPAALALPTASAKLKFKSKKDFDVEVKSDGTVNSGGKAAAKITGMELQDPAGKSQLKVDSDGAVTTGDGAAYGKFDGDDFSTLTSTKYSIGDDGAFNSTDEKGKKTALGKTDGVGAAKRSAILAAAFVMWGTKAPAPPAGKKPADKPDGKKGGDKPAGDKKPGGKK
jgi:hypothetical protein